MRLRPEQLRVVDQCCSSRAGSRIRLIGGAGCAKSTGMSFISHEFSNTNCKVLILTFNRKAADSMAAKLQKLNDKASTRKRVDCMTFCGFAMRVFPSYQYKWDLFSSKKERKRYTIGGTKNEDNESFEDETRHHLPSLPYKWLVSADPLSSLDSSAAEVWANVFERKKGFHMLEKLAFKYMMLNEAFCKQAFSLYDVVVWDEAQDMDAVKWAISRQIADTTIQIFGGDPYQCINVWNGAYFDGFANRQAFTKNVTLTCTFRLSNNVLCATNSWAKHMRSRCDDLPVELTRLTPHVDGGGGGGGGYIQVYRGMSEWGRFKMFVSQSKGNKNQTEAFCFYRTNANKWTFLARHILDLKKMKSAIERRGGTLNIHVDPKKTTRLVEWLIRIGRNPAYYRVERRKIDMSAKALLSIHKGNVDKSLATVELIKQLSSRTTTHARKRKFDHISGQMTLFGVAVQSAPQLNILFTTVHTQKGAERPFVFLSSEMTDEDSLNTYTNNEEEKRIILVAISRCNTPNGISTDSSLARCVNSITAVHSLLKWLPIHVENVLTIIHDYIGYDDYVVPAVKAVV